GVTAGLPVEGIVRQRRSLRLANDGVQLGGGLRAVPVRQSLERVHVLGTLGNVDGARDRLILRDLASPLVIHRWRWRRGRPGGRGGGGGGGGGGAARATGAADGGVGRGGGAAPAARGSSGAAPAVSPPGSTVDWPLGSRVMPSSCEFDCICSSRFSRSPMRCS